MRNEEQNSAGGRDPEATVVKPLFTEAAEETARPVVPLGQPGNYPGAHAHIVVPVAPYGGAAARSTSKWALALVAASLLTGLVVGVAGLRLYQRSRTAAAQPAQPAAAEQISTAPEATQAETEPATAEQPTDLAADGQPDEESAVVEPEVTVPVEDEEANDRTEAPAAAPPADDDGDARRVRETAESAPARAPREDEDDDEDSGRRRRGRDDDGGAAVRVRPDGVYDTQGPSPEGSAAARRAEREEQRLRRAERQRRREERRQRRAERYEGETVDSVRGIFEGRPPR